VIAGLVRRNENFRIARLPFDLSNSKEVLAYESYFCRKPTHRNYPWRKGSVGNFYHTFI